MLKTLNTRSLYFLGFCFCLIMMAYALYAEYQLLLTPCPLCVLQRLAVSITGIIFLPAAIQDPQKLTLNIYTIILTFWVTGTVFCAVCLFMSYCVWKFRYRKDQKAAYEPENSKLEWGLTIFTTIGVCALLAPGLIVWDKYVDVPEEAMDIEVMGQQWYRNFRLPGADGVLGLTVSRNINDDTPFGINLDVPNGLDICKERLYALIDKIEKVNVNEEQIEPFLPYIYEKLNWLDRKKLIKHFVSTEFNRYLSYYKNSKDINVETYEKGNTKRQKRNRRKFFNSTISNRKNKRNKRQRAK